MRVELVRTLVSRLRRRRPPDHVYVEVIDASWHVSTEAICPDCLRWISPDDYVRRNAFDLLEHEVCPPPSARLRR
ncbi:MAG: hypothetical protein ACXV3C_07795 [Actinomycetes bacterium]